MVLVVVVLLSFLTLSCRLQMQQLEVADLGEQLVVPLVLHAAYAAFLALAVCLGCFVLGFLQSRMTKFQPMKKLPAKFYPIR